MTQSQRVRRCFAFVWLCGATIGPVGDHFHVATGVTEYLTDFGIIWLGESPLWFALLVASFMGSLAVIQAQLDRGVAGRASDLWIFTAPFMVGGLYLLTSFWPWRGGMSLEAVVTLAALLMYLGFDRSLTGALVGIVAAVFATGFELGLVKLGVFRYLPQSDELFGVAPFLLPLYFAASVGVGAVARRMAGRRLNPAE